MKMLKRNNVDYSKIPPYNYLPGWFPFSSLLFGLFLYVMGPNTIIFSNESLYTFAKITTFPIEYSWLRDEVGKNYELIFICLGSLYFITTFLLHLLMWVFGSPEWRKLTTFDDINSRKKIAIAAIFSYIFAVLMIIIYDNAHYQSKESWGIEFLTCAAPLFKGVSASSIFLAVSSLFLSTLDRSRK